MKNIKTSYNKSRKTDDPIKTWTNDQRRYFSKKDTQTASKHTTRKRTHESFGEHTPPPLQPAGPAGRKAAELARG